MTNYVRDFVAAVGSQLAGAQKAIQAGNCVLEPDRSLRKAKNVDQAS